jgi:predicted MFS family arabinose efflux permease
MYQIKKFALKSVRVYKESFKGHPKEIWALTGLTFINRLGTMVLPFLSVYLTTELHFSLHQAGILMGAFGVGSFMGAYMGGRLSDIIGPKRVLLISLFFSGILLISLQFAKEYYHIMALIMATAIIGEAYRPAIMAYVGNWVPKEQTARTIALIRTALNLGFSAGPALGGFIVVAMGYEGIFWIDGLTCIAAVLFFASVSRNWKEKYQSGKKAKLDNVVDAHIFKDQQYMMLLLIMIFVGIAFVQWFQSAPVFIKTNWLFDERYIGGIMALNGLLIAFTEMPIIHIIEKKKQIKNAMLLGLVFISISFFFFLLPPAMIWGVIGMIFMTLGEIFYLPLINTLALSMSPDHRRGEYMALYTMTWSVAHILGPTIGLSVAEKLGFSFFWIIVIFLMLFTIVLQWFLFRKLKV